MKKLIVPMFVTLLVGACGPDNLFAQQMQMGEKCESQLAITRKQRDVSLNTQGILSNQLAASLVETENLHNEVAELHKQLETAKKVQPPTEKKEDKQ